MPVTITPKICNSFSTDAAKKTKIDTANIVLPGEVIYNSGTGLITGHGTYRSSSANDQLGIEAMDMNSASNNQQNAMMASLGGHLQTVSKLIYVDPPKCRYSGNVGDTIVGRVIGVEQRRWMIDINSYQHAVLQLANVKLPGGELRRKCEDDERAMRSYIKEGDLIVAEVHETFRDGSMHLHMPGIRTGRLGEGCFARVPPSSIKKQKLHRHQLSVPKGLGSGTSKAEHVSVGLILGCNGYVWIGPAKGMSLGVGTGASIGFTDNLSQADMVDEFLSIARVRNCVIALALAKIPIWELSVLTACEASWLEEKHTHLPGTGVIAQLTSPEMTEKIANMVRIKLGLVVL